MLIFTRLDAFPKFTIKCIVKIYINNAKKLITNIIRIARRMWSKLTICYESKLDPNILDDVTDDRIKLKNIPYSGYGRKCRKLGQHGIEVRVCARRNSFLRDNDNNAYKIEYKINVKLGFSYSHKRQKLSNLMEP
uniref:Uncharacterized protein n=1 Tax=Meloidogyne incognita TaxID=6306 RepID=A0A914NIV6_MELIC